MAELANDGPRYHKAVEDAKQDCRNHGVDPDDHRDDRLTPLEIEDRNRIWREADSRVCEGCGAEWTEDLIEDPTWFADVVMIPDRTEQDGYRTEYQIRCPKCW